MDDLINSNQCDYHEVTIMYVTLLISNEMLKEAHSVLLTEISVPYVEKNHLEEYNRLLDLVATELRYNENSKREFTNNEIEKIFSGTNNDFEKTVVIEYLLTANIRNHLEPLINYLKSEDNDPTLKTLILDILITQEVNQILEVRKFNDTTNINPSVMSNSLDNQIIELGHSIFYQTLDDNPSQMLMAEELLRNYIVGRFPFIDDLNIELLCASLHGLVLVYNNEVIDFDYLSDLYDYSSNDIETSMWEVSNFLEFVYEK